MKTYTDLYLESPKAFLRKLEEDIKGIEARLSRLDTITSSGIGRMLIEYERLALLVESKAYGIPVVEAWSWSPETDGLAQENLYAPEKADDRWFCWTGPSAQTSFTVPVRRDIVQTLRVDCTPGPDLASLDSVQVLVDGEPQPIALDAEGLTVQLPVRERLSALPTLVVLDTARTVKPGNGDERELGIGLYKLNVGTAAADAEEPRHG